MPDRDSIAIVGGGPAGSVAAALLAGAGRRVTLFDEKLAWEKPCGGGITHKAIVHWPWLCDVNCNWVHECEFISPSGRRVSFPLEQPIAIFSRQVLNGLLLEKAGEAGAHVICDHVVSIARRDGCWHLKSTRSDWEAGYVVIAAGVPNPFRKQLGQAFAPEDLMVTTGYYIPGHSQKMRIQFLPDQHGYIWIFPRTDHFSAGICGRMNAQTPEDFRNVLERALADFGLEYKGAQFFSHLLPVLRRETLRHAPLHGEGWALIGDAAGLVDALTGEGLYYAMRSAELLSQALLADQPDSYPELLRQNFLPELEIAAELAGRFYTGRLMGEAVIERVVQFIADRPSFRGLMSDMFAGTQGYRDLRRRLYRTLPRMLAESLASTLRLPTLEPEVEAHSRAG
jgi:geranylgeranyl diphosphate/geranylgeranyl-bacteriochlorophyllide a reductase